jgi:hypothetical protein
MIAALCNRRKHDCTSKLLLPTGVTSCHTQLTRSREPSSCWAVRGIYKQNEDGGQRGKARCRAWWLREERERKVAAKGADRTEQVLCYAVSVREREAEQYGPKRQQVLRARTSLLFGRPDLKSASTQSCRRTEREQAAQHRLSLSLACLLLEATVR